MRVTIISHDLAENAVGRAYSLWSVCRQLGHRVTVIGPQRGPFWWPLRGSDFAYSCVPVSRWPDRNPGFLRTVADSDVAIAVKAWPASFGSALYACERHEVPLVLDIDEDDYNALVGSDADLRRRAKSLLRLPMRGTSVRAFQQLQDHARFGTFPRMISNPALLDRFPHSTVVPHARPVAATRRAHLSGQLTVGFVGTVRAHKGLAALRAAVRELRGVRLVVTAQPPADALPHEEWVGWTTLEAGRSLLARCDVLVAASSTSGYGRTQLPAKVIDAMSLGVVPVGTDTAPIRWALADGRAGLLLTDGRVPTIAAALARLTDDSALRDRLGQAAHHHAQERFSIEAVASQLTRVLERATRWT